MQSATIIVLLCLIAAVVASVHEQSPAQDALRFPEDSVYQYDSPAHERSPRTKRGLLLLKKKLLLGALGLKAAKIGAVGAGVAGAIALKKQSVPSKKVRHEISYGHAPSWNVEVHSFSG
ncbi:uncharacterized protein [Epargyreus clarus]|uniref:uncharacterized protein isoform X2 n=1 Tax=Epargyreus clarus TaxID=520877 RepID=UPI003C2B8D66